MTECGGTSILTTCEFIHLELFKYPGFLRRRAQYLHHIATQTKRRIMLQQILSFLCSGSLFVFAANAVDYFEARSYVTEDVIDRDVAIIGGGASGTFSAIQLRRLGKSVVLIERDAELGGHSNTYTDPSTGVSIDYGTQAFWNRMLSKLFHCLFCRSRDAVYDLRSQCP